jgi:anti-sigma B factor antagonist
MEVREVSDGAEPGRLVLEVTGEVDLANCDGLESAVAAVFAAPERPGALVLDLAEVSFLDSSGLRVVLSAAGLARTGGVDLSVIPSPAVARVFELAGIRPDTLKVEEAGQARSGG